LREFDPSGGQNLIQRSFRPPPKPPPIGLEAEKRAQKGQFLGPEAQSPTKAPPGGKVWAPEGSQNGQKWGPGSRFGVPDPQNGQKWPKSTFFYTSLEGSRRTPSGRVSVNLRLFSSPFKLVSKMTPKMTIFGPLPETPRRVSSCGPQQIGKNMRARIKPQKGVA